MVEAYGEEAVDLISDLVQEAFEAGLNERVVPTPASIPALSGPAKSDLIIRTWSQIDDDGDNNPLDLFIYHYTPKEHVELFDDMLSRALMFVRQ